MRAKPGPEKLILLRSLSTYSQSAPNDRARVAGLLGYGTKSKASSKSKLPT